MAGNRNKDNRNRRKRPEQNRNDLITAVVANRDGEIFELEGYAAVGMRGPKPFPLLREDSPELPHGGELMMLPERMPLLYDLRTNSIEAVSHNPYDPEEEIYPVAAFNSPGYVVTHVTGYEEEPGAAPLPLFSYGAVGWADGTFRTAVTQVDSEPRQDLRLMPVEKVEAGVREMAERLPENRLREHLENCALNYGCPAGKNFFLGRFEAPLPTSRHCNARCLGCISLQEPSEISCCQERIAFTPTPEEIAGIALTHIGRVEKAVVSFGQGCEGDPLLAAEAIEPAIIMIREATASGTINMNTNASLPDRLEQLFDAGLDSIRVSMNSVRKPCYDAYFRPNGYAFEDVLKSIDIAGEKGKHVAINYLNCPGITDTPEEFEALVRFLEEHPVDFIQWRNLNFDPLRYFVAMRMADEQGAPMGADTIIKQLKTKFPKLGHGYFNPPKERFGLAAQAETVRTKP